MQLTEDFLLSFQTLAMLIPMAAPCADRQGASAVSVVGLFHDPPLNVW
jgi:hypothetical protein